MKTYLVGAVLLATTALSGTAIAGSGDNYSGFPVTVKGYSGSKTTSVAYTGQIARHLLHESLKKLAGKGNGQPNEALKNQMLSYYSGKDEGRAIVAPTSKGVFVFKQSKVDEISKKKELAGKTYKGTVSSWPNAMTGPEVVKFWIEKASSANKGVDAANGYNYPQLISKFIMGAVFYNQIADNYLDEKLNADKKPNNKPYKKGAYYTGKEHSWDEGFGYFGAAAHTASLTAKQSYEIAKLGSKSKDPKATMMLADQNKDGKIDYYSEMTYALAYYASSYDKGGKTNYLQTINTAFLDGRKLIAIANGEALTDVQRAELKGYAATVKSNLEKVLAESVFKYAGSVYKDIQALKAVMEANGDNSKALKKYIKHWGELKGFSMALQVGGKDLGETATRMNRMIGVGPLMPNSSQVVDIDKNGNYVKDQGTGYDEYALHMLKVQRLMVEKFGVQARNNDQLAAIKDLTDKLGGSNSAEND